MLSPVLKVDDPEEITISWSPSSGVLRYILEVRQFIEDGPGKEKPKTINGYPRELSGTVLEHTVTDLSEILSCCSLQLHSSLSLSLSAVIETPYNYLLVAGNTHGCGPVYNSPTFFTKEGSKLGRKEGGRETE